ncbi:hypothetical protein VCR14J2_390389 [Vibrio coralliirubri]|uniref:hypothetical protein n=1 Tax=Vibrio coralliirubri TaxID=1516159 RepID=UPI00063589A5|nr:hypothetical protein [Vibrio coralliirubri]CDU05796.1 hypothetical protein VCR14J2_390389 [Vibrio coralliirubri]
MSNIVTAVKIAVDSGALDSATSKADELSKTAGVKIPDGFKKAATSAVAVTAAIAAAVTAAESLSNELEQQSQRGYDFYNTMDSQVRPSMVYIAETIEAQNAALDQQKDLAAVASANMAIGWNKVKIAAGGVWQEYGLGIKNAEEATDKFIKDFADSLATDQINEENGILDNFFGKREAIDKRSEEIQASIRKDMDKMNEAAETLSQASAERRLQRLEGMNDTARERRDKQFAQEIKEREAAIVLAANDSQKEALEAELKRFKEAQKNFNDHLNEQEQMAAEAEQRQAAEGVRQLWLRNQEADVILADQIGKEKEAWKERYEQGLIDEEAYKMALTEIEVTYQNGLADIREQANAEAVKVAKKAAEDMSSATSSALSILDDDLANLFDSINSLVSVLQTLKMVDGAGGIFGLAGGIGGSGGGLSSFGGISVGTVSVSVQGNTDTVGMKNSAQEGVYGALNGIVKDTLAKESKYGGIFNPSSGTHRM